MDVFNTDLYTNFIGKDKTRAAHYKALIRRLNLDKEKIVHILDVGCGSGNFAQLLTTLFNKVKITGFDPAQSLIEDAKSVPSLNINFIHSGAENFRSNEIFEDAVSTLVLPYAPNIETLSSMFTSAALHLKPAGRFISVIFNPHFKPANEQVVANRRFELFHDNRIRIYFLSPENPSQIIINPPPEATLWSENDYETAAKSVGFKNTKWIPLNLDKQSNELEENAPVEISKQPYIIFEATMQ